MQGGVKVKNILFIMTDQQRADQTGYRGRYDTPTIDSIAEFSSFECCTVNPICTPARCALLTGRYPRQVGMVTMSGDLDYQIPTMPQALKRAGYTTYGIGKFHFMQTWPWGTGRGEGWDFLKNEAQMHRFGFDFVWETAGKQQLLQNYDHYCAYLDQKGLLEGYRDFIEYSGGMNGDTADHNYDRTLPFPFDEEDYVDCVTGRIARERLLAHDARKPFYMFVSFCGPHKPYDPPRRYMEMFPIEREDNFVLEAGQQLTDAQKEAVYRERRAAKAMLKLIDDQIQMLLDVLAARNMAQDTLVVFTSDHGDMLGDHFLIQKGVPWRQSVMVPLAMRVPGLKPRGATGVLAELTDVSATILDYAGLDPEKALSREWPAYNDRIPARSLLPVLRGDERSVRAFAFSESDFTEERIGVRLNMSREEYQRLRGAGRSPAWQMILSDTHKYVKYLGYDRPGNYHEELFDLRTDPDETVNCIDQPGQAEALRLARDRLTYVLDTYPPAQTTWTDSRLKELRHEL